MTNPLTLKDFDFAVPEHLVAQEPASKRAESRLLFRDYSGKVAHHSFTDIAHILPPNTLIILNNTRVIQSRLHAFTETGARVEVFLLEQLTETKWRALAKPLKKIGVGKALSFPSDHQINASLSASVQAIHRVDSDDVPTIDIEFNFPQSNTKFDFANWLEAVGETPLPPYIKRQASLSRNTLDKERYQTVFAAIPGSVAAPTAGLHFTNEVLSDLRKQGIQTAFVTLHVGGGTFLPVKKNDPRDHQIHSEIYHVPKRTLEMIAQTKATGGRICCVGTTAFRTIESLWKAAADSNSSPSSLADKWHQTRLYIFPEHSDDRYKPLVTDYLLTNFHQPKSTLIMLVSALIGFKQTKDMYRVAVEHNYRFYSYGDATLLELDQKT